LIDRPIKLSPTTIKPSNHHHQSLSLITNNNTDYLVIVVGAITDGTTTSLRRQPSRLESPARPRLQGFRGGLGVDVDGQGEKEKASLGQAFV
jgi:hypothetical protein